MPKSDTGTTGKLPLDPGGPPVDITKGKGRTDHIKAKLREFGVSEEAILAHKIDSEADVLPMACELVGMTAGEYKQRVR